MELREYQHDCINNVRKMFKQGFKSLCVVLPCRAGKSVIAAMIAKGATYKKNYVLFLVHRKELCKQIEETFKQCGVDMDYCTIGMVQTISNQIKKQIIEEPSIIITDETHHSTASTYKSIYNKFPNAFKIGFTATPIRLDGTGLGDIYEKLIIGVEAEYLIENKYMSDYSYYNNKLIDFSGVKTRCGDYDLHIIDGLADNPILYTGAVDEYKRLANGCKAIAYCTSIHNAIKLCEEFKSAGITSDYINGSQKKQERDKALNDFKEGKIKVLTSVEVISEGIDIPDCECTILLRPTNSLGMYIQQSMRCLNYVEGKKAKILDLVGNIKHGLPTQKRNWDLNISKKKTNQENTVEVKTCPECFAVLPLNSKICICGYDFSNIIKNEGKELEQVKAELIEFNRKQRIITSYNDCHNIDELFQVMQVKGYKPISVFLKAKEYGFKLTYEHLKKIAKLSGYHWKWAMHKLEEIK